MNKCENCGFDIRPTKTKCSVCQYKEFQEKNVVVEIKQCDYYVILELLEESHNKSLNGEQHSEFKKVLNNWKKLSNNFEAATII